MKIKNNNGSSKIGVVFFILLCASIALNVILLNGCDKVCKVLGVSGKDKNIPLSSSTSSETSYLRELAKVLGIKVSSDKTPGDIAFEIKQCLDNRQKYQGDVLSKDSFEKACTAIRITKDQETFKAYHEFISNIAGKTIIVFE